MIWSILTSSAFDVATLDGRRIVRDLCEPNSNECTSNLSLLLIDILILLPLGFIVNMDLLDQPMGRVLEIAEARYLYRVFFS